MKKHHDVQKVAFQDDVMSLTVDGKEYTFPLSTVSKRLLKAAQQERATFEISASGYGIHWPLVDEDLSIDGLLDIKHQPRTGRANAAV